MSDVLDWLTTTSQGQFLVGVIVLIFGSKAVLSEDNLKGKLSGLTLPGRWFRRRQQKAAEKEIADDIATKQLVSRQHRYIVHLTALIRSWEIDAADKGYVFPPPKYLTFSEWVDTHCPDDDAQK